jgi:hypothetical protein
VDGEPHVHLYAKGWWKRADGHTLLLDKGTNPVHKVGRKYFHIGDVDGETVKATPIYDSDNPAYQNAHLEVQEGTATDHTSL